MQSMDFKISQLFFLKRQGISVLVSCQDDHETLRDCVESFLCFGDEILIISNRATGQTVELADRLQTEYSPTVRHIEAADAVDLYQNRQAGLEHARYRWVVRCDADYIAYEPADGDLSASGLRERVLQTTALWPTAFFLTKVSLSMGWGLMYEPGRDEVDVLKFIPQVFTGKKEARIYSQNPFLRFARLGRWEGVPGIRWYRKVEVKQPYWFEVTIRAAESLLLRKARTDWRQLGDTDSYPMLIDYVEKVFLPSAYPGMNLQQAAETYVSEEVMPKIVPYDESRFFRLPARIRRRLQ